MFKGVQTECTDEDIQAPDEYEDMEYEEQESCDDPDWIDCTREAEWFMQRTCQWKRNQNSQKMMTLNMRCWIDY
ncbi:hypothetical protein AC249_AIPGENE28313 [Exaiptasia diaphana]|nr:hypothetical protein AC249_AIPGENE28313 [Exaiptasia diaphana]